MPTVPPEPLDAKATFRAPIGTHDVLPPASERWITIVQTFAERAARYGYGLVVTPMFEHREVFLRVGDSTDVIRKEMYEFEDKGGRAIALRPEGTAPVVRAYVEHHPTPPWKVWYLAPNFRYERPQKGRYRQHWQLGAEVLGADDVDVDVEVIALAYGFFRDLQIPGRLLLNSMGEPADRVEYVARLREHLLAHVDALGDDFRQRVDENPLRLLDSKREDWQDVIERAPQLTEYLSDESRAHFEGVQQGLDALGIVYELTPRLVRGFDYYTSTTFELASDALDAAQNALCGGGRYDQLAQDMGGKPTPGIGFGIGIERLLIAADAAGVLTIDERDRLDAFLIDGIGGPEPAAMLEALRASGLRADRSYGGRSVKAQWKVADRSGAAYGVMLGAEEAARDAVAVKDLSTGAQVEVPRDQLVGWLRLHCEAEE
jgi:histidyl-tRNA synthetase